ncbi:molybdenum cofactor biosynthesis protein MoaE [Mobilicoccus pelagius]|nr:molybdenum cofactor biosynthesis protein MoaE [Mobilicoccus pelagius]
MGEPISGGMPATTDATEGHDAAAAADGAARPLVGVREEPLSVDEVLAAVTHPRVGGVVTFLGVVRNHDDGKGVDGLDYSAHPTATDALTRLVQATLRRDGVVTVAAVHRTGHLDVGDLAVVLAVGAEHRGEAFEACRALIDDLKAEVPIWKHQLFDDGSDEWVGTP